MARVVLGAQLGGSLGLRTSAFGADALTGTDDGHSITFDSSWTDLTKLNAIGIASEANVTIPGGTTSFWRPYATFPNLGYKPFAELRKLESGTLIRDDYYNASLDTGSYCIVEASEFFGPITGTGASSSGSQMLFAIYQIAVPSGQIVVTRIVLGPRANGDRGLFISPAGVDADTAADSALLLNATSKISQLLLMGRITSTQTITLGLGRSPLVFITSEFNWSGVAGHTAGAGPFRPSPPPGSGAASTATINSNGISVTITLTLPTTFQVYSQAFT